MHIKQEGEQGYYFNLFHRGACVRIRNGVNETETESEIVRVRGGGRERRATKRLFC